MRRDARSAGVLSEFRGALQYCHLHATGHADQFQQSQAEWREQLTWSSTEGAQFRIRYEETRTANDSIAPEVTRLQAREPNFPPESLQCEIKRRSYKDSCKISTERTLWSTLSWIKLRWWQTVRCTLEVRSWRSNGWRQTSNSLDNRQMFLTFELRWSGINLPKIKTQKIFEVCGKKLLLWLVKVFAVGQGWTINHKLQEAERRRRALNLCGKTRKNIWTVGVALQKKSIPQVSDLEILLYWLPRTPLETNLTPFYEIFPSRAQFLFNMRFFFSDGGRGVGKNQHYVEEQGEEPSVLSAKGNPMRSCQKLSLKRKKPRNLTSRKFSNSTTLVFLENDCAREWLGARLGGRASPVLWQCRDFPNVKIKSELCFPTEAHVWIIEVDSAKNMNEWKSSSSRMGRIISDLVVFQKYDKRWVLRGRA